MPVFAFTGHIELAFGFIVVLRGNGPGVVQTFDARKSLFGHGESGHSLGVGVFGLAYLFHARAVAHFFKLGPGGGQVCLGLPHAGLKLGAVQHQQELARRDLSAVAHRLLSHASGNFGRHVHPGGVYFSLNKDRFV